MNVIGEVEIDSDHVVPPDSLPMEASPPTTEEPVAPEPPDLEIIPLPVERPVDAEEDQATPSPGGSESDILSPTPLDEEPGSREDDTKSPSETNDASPAEPAIESQSDGRPGRTLLRFLSPPTSHVATSVERLEHEVVDGHRCTLLEEIDDDQ
jgi:hypothetical protein